MSKFPGDLRYTKDHEWARMSESNVVIGVTSFAVDQLGDITLVELPEVGSVVKAGASFGTIESVKSVSELYAPVSGEVVRINTRLEDEPELINESPYEEGWMVEIGPSDAAFQELMSASEYSELVERESSEA